MVPATLKDRHIIAALVCFFAALVGGLISFFSIAMADNISRAEVYVAQGILLLAVGGLGAIGATWYHRKLQRKAVVELQWFLCGTDSQTEV